MSLYRALLLALFVVGGAVTAGVAAGATIHDSGERVADRLVGHDGAESTGGGSPASGDPADVRTADVQDGATNNTTGGSSLGADISAFMQASASEVDGAVDNGMWTAAFNDTENRSKRVQLVESRTQKLRSTLAELRERKAELVAERAAGNVSETAYKAKLSGLVGRINALESSINVTSDRAEKVGANVEALGRLRAATANLTGPQLASVARNVTGVAAAPVTPGNGRQGPPNGANGTGDGNGLGVGNGTDVGNGTGVGNGGGPNASEGNGVGNATGANGNASASNAGGDGQNAGNGNGAAGQNNGGNGNANVSLGSGAGSDATPGSAADGVRNAVTAAVDGSAETVLAATTATSGRFGHVETALEVPAITPVGAL